MMTGDSGSDEEEEELDGKGIEDAKRIRRRKSVSKSEDSRSSSSVSSSGGLLSIRTKL